MSNALALLGLFCILLIPVAECDEIACPRKVTGLPYGKVSFQCHYSAYPKANKYTRKFCCLQSSRPGRCRFTIVSDNGYTANQFLERIVLEDNREENLFTVTITGLNKEDQGTYICGLGDDNSRITSLLTLSIPDSITTMDAELIYTQLGGSAIFKCASSQLATTYRRHLCKVTKNGCIHVIDSIGRTGSSYEGRVVMDNQKAGTFIVKMVNVRNSDAAIYSCGSDNPEESPELPTYDLRINDVMSSPQGSPVLTPQVGGSLSAQCNYDPTKEYKSKFWCKLRDGVCNPIVQDDGYMMDAYEGRALVHDNSTSGLMQVLMNNISKEDEGWYWCVITGEKHDHTSSWQVRISEGEWGNLPGLSGKKIVRAVAGDLVKMTCSYPCRFKKAEKYWCHWSNHGCTPMSNVEDTQDVHQVSCQTEELVLNIESVSKKDSGFYWCGVKEGDRYGESITVRLVVEEPTRDVPNTNVRANFDGGAKNVEGVDTPPSTDSGKSGTVAAAVVSVCAAVLLAGAVFLILRFKKRRNTELVSVGSYRTNISMSDLDHNVGKENPTATDLQETDISHPKDSPKTKKKGSQEDLEYSCFLINNIGDPNEQVAH